MSPPLETQPKQVVHQNGSEKRSENILPNILADIGHTPLVRINQLAKEEGVKCELLVKCEYRNPGGSLKDRVAARMIAEAEAKGDLRPGMTIIEPTSGNTGISVAMLAAVKGYKAILVLNDKMSKEKADIMASLGATVVRASKLAHEFSPDSHIGIAKRLNALIPDSFILNQYYNEGNPMAHFDGTAQEIIDDCGGRLDMVVVGAGTCGTLTGVGRKMKQAMPNVRVIGVDPEGSLLARDEDAFVKTSNKALVEGIGHKFLPGVLDRSIVDEWVKIRDEDSFDMARRIIRTEGLMVGGSSGAVLWAAIQAAKKLDENQRCVVVLADGIRNYITHFVSNDWMTARDYPFTTVKHHTEWRSHALQGHHAFIAAPTSIITLADGAKTLRAKNTEYMLLQDDNKRVRGIVTLGNIEYTMSSGRAQPSASLVDHVYPSFGVRSQGEKMTLGDAADAIRVHPYVLIVKPETTLNRDEVTIGNVVGVIDADIYTEQAVGVIKA